MKPQNIYRCHRFPPAMISHCVWLYYRFSLSFRDIELMMAEKGIVITYESIRYWCLKFSREFSRKLRVRHTGYGDQWFLDEVFCKINGQIVYLWRAVDQDGQTIDILVQKKRDSKAAKRFLQKLRKQGGQPRLIVTDKLKSYIKPCAQLFPSSIHTRSKGENNRAENSHQATRLRERKMRKFKSIKQAQQFLANFGTVYDFFKLDRHLVSAKTFRTLVLRRLKIWCEISQVASTV
ncbi:IS6 family transposase [Neisseria sp. Ec49-e6-T10]|uniref:IS6 family transposase n=1 Tax=Neisseria sp. Ec49-e6-T10 TaxID=3140744 RepID=UPI003EC0D44E